MTLLHHFESDACARHNWVVLPAASAGVFVDVFQKDEYEETAQGGGSRTSRIHHLVLHAEFPAREWGVVVGLGMLDLINPYLEIVMKQCLLSLLAFVFQAVCFWRINLEADYTINFRYFLILKHMAYRKPSHNVPQAHFQKDCIETACFFETCP